MPYVVAPNVIDYFTDSCRALIESSVKKAPKLRVTVEFPVLFNAMGLLLTPAKYTPSLLIIMCMVLGLTHAGNRFCSCRIG